MTLEELKRLFKKQIPAAYDSLKEAEVMPEGEMRRYKVSAALQTIEQAQELLTSCWDKLRFKDGLILAHRAENVPREHTAMVFYDYAHIEPVRAVHNIKALEELAYKKLHKLLSAQENDSERLEAKRKQSMAERLKARKQRTMG